MSGISLDERVRKLVQKNDELRAQVAGLRADNRELLKENKQLSKHMQALKSEVSTLLKLIEE